MSSTVLLLVSSCLCICLTLYLQPTTALPQGDLEVYDHPTGVRPPKKSTTLLLTKILEDPEQARELVRLLEALEGRRRAGTGGHRDTSEETRKREAAWDMDYGWGGGRFGKRMDSLGMAGRFGRSVEGKAV